MMENYERGLQAMTVTECPYIDISWSLVNPSECYAIVECLKNSDFHNLTPGHDHNNIAWLYLPQLWVCGSIEENIIKYIHFHCGHIGPALWP